jgi:hypothetical protein
MQDDKKTGVIRLQKDSKETVSFVTFEIMTVPLTLMSFCLAALIMFVNPVAAQESCAYLDQYLAPIELPVETWPEAIAGPAQGDVQPRLVGPTECRVVAEKSIRNAQGVPYRQISMAISGTVFGYAPVNSVVLPPLGTGEAGEGQEHFFSDHAFIWQARGIMGPFLPGVGRYEYSEETPAGVEILIPQDPADWNGNMWVLVHGGGRFPPLRFHPRKPDQFNRYTETSESAGALMDMGYAVIWTRRDATTDLKSSIDVANIAELDNGMVVGGPRAGQRHGRGRTRQARHGL